MTDADELIQIYYYCNETSIQFCEMYDAYELIQSFYFCNEETCEFFYDSAIKLCIICSVFYIILATGKNKNRLH